MKHSVKSKEKILPAGFFNKLEFIFNLPVIGEQIWALCGLAIMIPASFLLIAVGQYIELINNLFLYFLMGLGVLIFLFLLVRQDILKDKRIKGFHLILPWILFLICFSGLK